MDRPLLLIFVILTTIVFGQKNQTIRVGLGSTYNSTMTVEQATSKPTFTLCDINSSDNVKARIMELTLVIKTNFSTTKFDLKEKITQGENRMEKSVISPPTLQSNHIDIIKKLKPGDKIILKDVKIVGIMCPTIIQETIITITQ